MASYINGDLQYGVATLSGESTLTADEITANHLTVTGGITATNTQDINFGSNPVKMSGANITASSIPDTSLSSNVALKSSASIQTFSNENFFSNTVYFDGPSNACVNSYKGIQRCGIDLLDIRIGSNALYYQTTTGKQNCAVGYSSLKSLSNPSASNNTALGTYAGENITNGVANGFFGANAGKYITSGSNNVCIGGDAGSGIITGDSNLAIGQAMISNVIASGPRIANNNTGIGANALAFLARYPAANTAIGPYALYNDSGNGIGGSYNTGIGPNAGVRLGSNAAYCTFIGGCYAEPSNVYPINSDYHYVTCIGVDARADKTHCVVLGTEQEQTIIRGGYVVYDTSVPGQLWEMTIDGILKYYDSATLLDRINLNGNLGRIICIDFVTENFSLNTTSFSCPAGTINSGMVDGTIHINGFGNPIFAERITLTNSYTSTIIGDNTTLGNPLYSVLIGNNAGYNLGANQNITAIGNGTLYSLTDSNGFENMAIGNGALYYLSKGNYNTGMGLSAGNALSYDCYENTFIGHNIAQTQFTKPITEIYYSGSTLTNTSTLTMTAIPSGLYAGCKVLTYYSGTIHTATLSSFNNTTFVLTLGNNVNITTGTFIFFYENSLTTATYANATLRTGVTSLTITAGLSIATGDIMSYQESATATRTVGVSAYNGTSGLLNLSSSVTILAATTLYFMRTTSPWGSSINNNTGYGSQTLSRLCTGTTGNVAIGQNTLASSDNTNPKFYLGGANNTAIGTNAGSKCTFRSNNNTFIGAGADIQAVSANTDIYNISNSTAVGAGATVQASNEIMLGQIGSTTVHIGRQLSVQRIWYPFSSTTITATTSLGAQYYGLYVISSSAASITLTFPATIPSALIGQVMNFRRIGATATVVNINYASGTNLIYFRNSNTTTSGTALTVFLPTTQWGGSLAVLSATEIAVLL